MNAAFLNGIANDPAVRPSLGGVGQLDMTAILREPHNYGLVTDQGGFVVIKTGPRVYECHSIFPEEARGIHTQEAMVAGLRYMFVNTDCLEVVTKVPDGNLAALGGCRAMGFIRSFVLDKGWPLPDGSMGPVFVYSLPIAKWAQRDAVAQAKGVWFHDRLEQLTGGNIPAHYDEPSHNQAVGASVMMFEAGNSIKATECYNRWAVLAGFSQVKMLSQNPTVLDMDNVIVGIANGDMEILSCR